jgi:hypothetical protein
MPPQNNIETEVKEKSIRRHRFHRHEPTTTVNNRNTAAEIPPHHRRNPAVD